MSEEKEKPGSGGAVEKAIDKFTSSIELVIRYFMTGAAICAVAYISFAEPQSQLVDPWNLPLEGAGIVALSVGFCVFTIYRVTLWVFADGVFWLIGSSAPNLFTLKKPLSYDKPYAHFLLWRYSDALPESLGGYLTYRWSVVHFSIVSAIAVLVASYLCADASLLHSHRCLVRLLAIVCMLLGLQQFWFLMRVERELCSLTKKAMNCGTRALLSMLRSAPQNVGLLDMRLLAVKAAPLLLSFVSQLYSATASADVKLSTNCTKGASLPCVNIRGVISGDDAVKVKSFLDSLDNSKATPLFSLDSEGGDVRAAIEIGRIMRRTRAFVFLDGNKAICLSSCIFLLAGGVQRGAIGTYGTIGIHRPFSTTTGEKEFDTAQREYVEMRSLIVNYLREMNVSESLYDAMVQVPPESLRILSQKDLEQFGLTALDPVEQELQDSAAAEKYGVSRLEYLRRKRVSARVCAGLFAKAERSGDFANYTMCDSSVKATGNK